MDKPKPIRLSRPQLEAFLPTPDLVRAFEAYIKALAELTPDELQDLQLAVASTTATVSTLQAELEADRSDAQAAAVLALSGQVEGLREQLASIQSSELLDLQAQVAQLRESVDMGQRIRRIEQHTITIGSGSLTGTYVTVPGFVGPVETRYLGCNSDDVDVDGGQASLTRAGDTFTATRNATGFITRLVFEFTEYYP